VHRITYLTDLAREAQKHETGGIVSEGESRVDPEDLRIRIGDFRNSQVSLKFTCSHFLYEYHPFLCNYVELMFMVRIEFMCYYSGIGSTFGMLRNRHLAELVVARAYLTPLASNTLLVPSRLAFLQRSASGTDLPAA